MKRVTILADAHVPGETPEQPAIVFAGSTLDLDDTVAGLLVVAGKARYDKDAKILDNTKGRMAELKASAVAAGKADAATQAMIDAAVARALAAAKPAVAATA